MAAECRSACSKAVFLKWSGGQPDLGNLGNCRGNEGSQNWPWGWALANEDWGRLGELLDEELASGLRQAEFGSEKYDPDVVAYRVASLARIPAAHPVRPKLVHSLRAYLAYLALTAVPGPRTRTRLRRPEARTAPDAVDHAYFESDGDARWYAGGVSVATPGHRWHPDSVAQSLLGPQLAWALGYPATYGRKISPANPDPDVEDDYTWPLALLELAVGAKFGRPTPPAAWGFEAGDRERLRAVIDGNPAAGVDLTAVVAMIQPYPLIGPFFIEVTATTEGRMARLEHAVNALKPQIACCKIDRAGHYEAVVPSSWSRGNADLSTTEDRGTFIAALAGEGEIDLQKIGGDRVFRFTWDHQGPRWAGATDAPLKPKETTTTTAPPVRTTTPPPAKTTTAPPATPTTPAPAKTTTPAPAQSTTTPPPVTTTTPVPVTTTPAPPATPRPNPAELAEIADGIEGLTLARKQRPLQHHLANELRTLPQPARPLGEIADDVATFGINPDQEQGPRWLALVARLRVLGGADKVVPT